MSLFCCVVQLLFLSTCALAGVKELWWNVTYVENANPDGLYARRVIGVNDTWPFVLLSSAPHCLTIDFFSPHGRPPPISVNTTDSLLIHVTNGLDEPTTLHNHGMFFNSTTWMDGAMGVSQW